MIRLLLIRHAKSSWDDPGLPDHDRPLNDRGRRGAAIVGRWLATEGLVPEHALVSTAVRARETWEGICAEIGPVPARFVLELYGATPEAILRVLHGAPAAGVLALVGHQPAIGEAARRLLARPPGANRFRKYPTAATAAIDFETSRWGAVDWGGGHLHAFETPKSLKAR